MMASDPRDQSPFAALSFAQQQDRWREWRSRQLDYQDAPLERPAPADVPRAAAPQEPPLPKLTLPFLRQAAPTRHQELDRVLARHAQAARQAGSFYPVTAGNTAPGPAAADGPDRPDK